MDYEDKLETLQVKFIFINLDHFRLFFLLQLQLTDEKSQNTILQRHELEHKKEFERLREKLAKYEDENTQGQCTIESLSREINDKVTPREKLNTFDCSFLVSIYQ